MERDNRSALATFYWDSSVEAGASVRLGAAPAQHARARRIRAGERVRLLDGRGRISTGEVTEISKAEVAVTIQEVVEVPRPLGLEVVVPIADRERMLLIAEKCVELQITSWRPAFFARSRSVTPRGEGAKFQEKVKARMQGAMEQSGSAWMPDVHDDAELGDAMRAVPATWQRVLLESRGQPLRDLVAEAPMVVAAGPEGGLEPNEIDAARDSGWVTASLGPTVLRFETALIAAVAVSRAIQLSSRSV